MENTLHKIIPRGGGRERGRGIQWRGELVQSTLYGMITVKHCPIINYTNSKYNNTIFIKDNTEIVLLEIPHKETEQNLFKTCQHLPKEFLLKHLYSESLEKAK
jgi:hypothetical protein